MLEQEFRRSQTSFDMRNYSSLSALVFLILDYLSTCGLEYWYIWRARSWTIKVLYLFARYFALVTGIAHYALTHMFLANGPVPVKLCRVWLILLLIPCATMMAVLDAILFLRVSALYKMNRKVYWLCIPIILQYIAGFMLLKCIALEENLFNSQCDVVNPQVEGAALGVLVVFTHATLLITLFIKRRATQGRVAVVNLVVNEGAWSFVLLSGVVVAVEGVAFGSRSPKTFILVIWPMSVMSVTSCRMIMSMRRLQVEHNPDSIPSTTAEDATQLTLTTIHMSLGADEASEERGSYHSLPSEIS